MIWVLVDTAAAHEPGLSNASAQPDGLRVTLSLNDAERLVPLTGFDVAGDLRRRVGETISVSTGMGPCAVSTLDVSALEDGVALQLSVDCPAGDWTYRAGFVEQLPASHRHIVDVHGEPVATLSPAQPVATLQAPTSLGVLQHYGLLGAEHVLSGADHLAFVLGLLISCRRVQEVGWLVTAFTVAHSVTLALAALGWLTLSPRVVEPLIALSVAWIGVEAAGLAPLRRRLALVLVFGLVHGLGFAGALTELQLPTGQLLPALLSFNVGVEAVQLGVAATLWLLWVRLGQPERLRWVLSAGLVAAGLGWALSRVLAP